MVIIIVFIQTTHYLSLSFNSRNRSPNLLKAELLLHLNGRHSDELLPQPPLLLPHPHKAQRDVWMAPPNNNVVDEASRQLSEVAKRRERLFFIF